jgi:hypothetical protein
VTTVIANVTIVKTNPKATIGTKIFIHLSTLYALILPSISSISVDTMMNEGANEKVLQVFSIYRERLEEKKND